jgi:hypothetical protein
MSPPAVRTRLALLLLSVCSLGICGESRADLDPGVNKPYRLRVVLGIAEHRLLTPVFQEQVERELGDSLQAALGELATVEVARQHPRLKDVLRDGLQQALDAWKDVDDVKTHFVLINYVNGEYEIQSRQHDGLTGQASAVVRRVRLSDPDRPLVARTAALMVGQDFGVVGTVTGKTGDDTVQVTLQGSGLGVPLERWLKTDEVLALVQITKGSGGERAARVPWALLRVQRGPDNGVCVCQLFHRHRDPLQQGRDILGYRCLKWSTTRAPLRLRLLQANAKAKTPPPIPNQRVDVRREGFLGEDQTRIQGATDADGYFSTEKDGDRGLVDNVAFVSVISGNTPLAQIPVPVVDDRPVVIPLSIGAAGTLELTGRRDLWISNVYLSYRALSDLFKDLESLLKAKKRDEALALAKTRLAGLKEDISRFGQQREELVKDAGTTDLKLGGGEQAVAQLRSGQDRLQDLIAKLEKVVTEQNDPKRKELQAKVSQAQVLEDQAEYGKALELYEQVMAAAPEDAELHKHYDKLKAAWQPKDDKHKQARQFIYETWPTLDPLKLLGHLEEARAALQTCEQAGDTLGPRKLLAAAAEHAGELQKRLDGLHPDASEDDRATAKVIVEVADGLGKLIKDVKAYLDRATEK